VGAWIYGRVTGPWKPRLHRLVWRSVALVVIGLGGWLSLAVLLPLYTGAAGGGLGSEPFSLAGLKRHLEEGRSVMVDWTADWCPNCKFVEQTVLHTEAVEKKVEEKGVVFMIADITRPHHDAQALMKKLGSQSIPFLGIFPAGDPYRPWILRDIYSQSALLEILAQIR